MSRALVRLYGSTNWTALQIKHFFLYDNARDEHENITNVGNSTRMASTFLDNALSNKGARMFRAIGKGSAVYEIAPNHALIEVQVATRRAMKRVVDRFSTTLGLL